ncbi:hypothetical protein MMC07_003769 [Pseudocyphellaria aurata]|nr:hypothetical protein [Pseudocyphellaria aurata]
MEDLPPHPDLPCPPPEKLNQRFILDEIRDYIKDFAELFPHVDLGILLDQITDVRNKNVNPETQIRQFLLAFKNTSTFKEAFDHLDAETKKKVELFRDGTSAGDIIGTRGFQLPPSPPAKHHFHLLDHIHSLFHRPQESEHQPSRVEAKIEPDHGKAPIVYEDAENKQPMKTYTDTPFQNWGENVKNTPRYTFVPTTVLGLQNVVKYAKANNFRVRCGGYRHSWSTTFSADKEILVSLLDLKEVTSVPDPLAIGPNSTPNGNQLKSIDILEKPKFLSSGKDIVRVGAAVTNEAFRRWAIHNKMVALPMDVILVEVTVGGVNAPICHGAGRRNKTISDQVVAIEYVDANGMLQTVTDPKQLKSAAGCFGLLGVVTHISFELDKMSYAILKPKKVPITLAIPPLQLSDVPVALYKNWTEKDLQAAKVDFENRAANDFYSEWFWYTYQSTSWVNTWNTTDDPQGAKEYPSSPGVFLQWLQGWIGGWFSQTFFFQHIPGHWQAQFLAIAGMSVLPPMLFDEGPVEYKTYLPDGLHFFRGIQNFRVRDMEFEIPIPALASDPSKPDLSIVQRAWWDAIKLVYREAQDGRSPMRLTMELRITGGSDMHMAPQFGNDHGTASIEVLTILNAVPEEWQAFKQKIADIWMSYEVAGKKLNARPHWAKEWQSLKVGGEPMQKYLKETAYKDQIPLFKAQLEEIGTKQGWTLQDIQKRFSNQLWDDIIYS